MCNRRDHAAVIDKFKSRSIAMFHTFDKTMSDLDSVFHALRLISIRRARKTSGTQGIYKEI